MNPEILAITTTAVVALIYAGSCWAWPMRDCWCCDGNGHHRPDDGGRRGKVSRPCRWCKGAGKRLRIGRRLANAIRARRQEGTR